MLDNAGFTKTTITVSNELDESIIQTLVSSGTPVDIWGVGTNLVTGGNDPGFTGVYKIAACEDSCGNMVPVMKISDNPEKNTNPGVKQVWRLRDSRGAVLADIMALEDPSDAGLFKIGTRCRFWHPSADYRHFYLNIESEPEPLLQLYLEEGEPRRPKPSLDEIRRFCAAGLESFDSTYKRLLNPHIYKVSVTEKIRNLKLDLIDKQLGVL
jgi:nicotinate phosphoribosyltransferase